MTPSGSTHYRAYVGLNTYPLWGLTGRSNGGSPVGVIGLIATGFVLLHLSRARQVGVGGPVHVGKQYNTAECDDPENQQWPQRTNQDSK